MGMGARGQQGMLHGGGLPLLSPTESGSHAASEGGTAYEESQLFDAGDFEGQPCTSFSNKSLGTLSTGMHDCV
eukprot:4918907-Heterocapsa_arctica.AAC.1